MPTYLNVLAWHFHLIEFGVVEFDKVAATLVKRLCSWAGVEVLFICVSPPLQPFDIFAQPRHVFHEVLLDSRLE